MVEHALQDLTERTEAQTDRLRAAEPWVLESSQRSFLGVF
jgi:hypothetical protein